MFWNRKKKDKNKQPVEQPPVEKLDETTEEEEVAEEEFPVIELGLEEEAIDDLINADEEEEFSIDSDVEMETDVDIEEPVAETELSFEEKLGQCNLDDYSKALVLVNLEDSNKILDEVRVLNIAMLDGGNIDEKEEERYNKIQDYENTVSVVLENLPSDFSELRESLQGNLQEMKGMENLCYDPDAVVYSVDINQLEGHENHPESVIYYEMVEELGYDPVVSFKEDMLRKEKLDWQFSYLG